MNLEGMEGITAMEIVIMIIIVAIAGMIIIPKIRVHQEPIEGIFDRVEYIPGGWGSMSKTIIHFEDGRTIVLKGHISVSYKKGKRIKVRR